MKPLRVLIADDSPIFVHALREILERDTELQVAGVATDGERAVRLTHELSPDVVLMDVLMPVMDGFAAVERIMGERPTPILMLTADPRRKSGELGFEALRRGALDLVPKPERWPLPDNEQDALRWHLKFLARISVIPHLAGRRHRWTSEPAAERVLLSAKPPALLAIVGSTGGPAAVARFLGKLKDPVPAPIVIVQHLPVGFVQGMRDWLASVSPLPVELARDGERLSPGVVYLADDNAHLTLGKGRVRLMAPTGREPHCPSGDALLSSVAQSYGADAAGVVLTGMGNDGAAGLLALRRAGGLTITQDESSSAVYGMPKAARDNGASAVVLPLDEMAPLMLRLWRRVGRGADGA